MICLFTSAPDFPREMSEGMIRRALRELVNDSADCGCIFFVLSSILFPFQPKAS